MFVLNCTSDYDFDGMFISAKRVAQITGIEARIFLYNLANDQNCFDAIGC